MDDPIAKRFRADRFDPDSAASWRPLRIVMDGRPPLYPRESASELIPVWSERADGVELRQRCPSTWRWLALLVAMWVGGLLWVTVAHGGLGDGLRSIAQGYGKEYFIFLGIVTLLVLLGPALRRSEPMVFTQDGRVVTGGRGTPDEGFHLERDGVGLLIAPMRFLRERAFLFLIAPKRCAMFLVAKRRFSVGGMPVVEYKVVATIAKLKDEVQLEQAIRSMPESLRQRLPMYLTLHEVDFSRVPNVDRAVSVG